MEGNPVTVASMILGRGVRCRILKRAESVDASGTPTTTTSTKVAEIVLKIDSGSGTESFLYRQQTGVDAFVAYAPIGTAIGRSDQIKVLEGPLLNATFNVKSVRPFGTANHSPAFLRVEMERLP